MFLVFGLLLLWTAVRLCRHRDEDPDIANNALVRLSRRILPVTDTYAGGRLISRSGGRRVVTPLFMVFITIGGTDLLFALDSIPAVFGVTNQPLPVIAVVLAAATMASLARSRRDPGTRARAGTSSGPRGLPPMSTALPAADRTGRRARRPTTEQNDLGESAQITSAALAALLGREVANRRRSDGGFANLFTFREGRVTSR